MLLPTDCSAGTQRLQFPPITPATPAKLNGINNRTGNGFIMAETAAAVPGATKPTAMMVTTTAGSASSTPGQQENQSQPEAGTDHISAHPSALQQDKTADSTMGVVSINSKYGNWEEINRHLQTIQTRLKEGWTVHVGKDGRLYYCNHISQTASWLPSCEDWSNEELPYGWEKAIDSRGRSYYINHLNKTSTYEAPESVRWDEHPPEPRVVVLQRSPTLGFGFVAGSERPVIVRFITDGGPSTNKLQPGDQILAVNDEDVKDAPRDHVITLVRGCETEVKLLVSQPARILAAGRKSTLLSAGKRAKLRTRPSRVRFAESVCVNGAPLFPPSAFSLGDICVPPMANVLKVFLENGQTKSFKYDATTTVQDVVTSLLDKLCLSACEHFSLVLEHVKSLKRNKLTLLDPDESLARIAARPGAHKLRCLFRISFVPISAAELARKDVNSLDYLYMQCCNDVTQERFAPELQPEVALRLAALHMHQHALANNIPSNKLNVKVVEREFGLERFVPISLFEGMKRKELRRLIAHFLKINAEMAGTTPKALTQLEAKLHYMDIIASLPSYGAKCFSTNQREGVERVLLISPRFGLSQISSARNSVPQPISAIEDFSHVIVSREDDVTCSVTVFMHVDRVFKFLMEDRDACEFSLVLAGYYRLLTGKELPVERERDHMDEDHAPSYLTQHLVLPATWSYLRPFHNRTHSISFLILPPYHPMKYKPQTSPNDVSLNGSAFTTHEVIPNTTFNTYGNQQAASSLSYIKPFPTDLDMHSVMATELLEEAKDSGMSDSSGGGSNYSERGACLKGSNSAFIEAKKEEVLRRVQEMQRMVESSEQYLSEQCTLGREYDEHHKSSLKSTTHDWQQNGNTVIGLNSAAALNINDDSDCDSLNSSKVSSNEETPQLSALKHSDSLMLLSETINHDLNGITKSLNSIGGSHQELRSHMPRLNATTSPRPERKFNDFGQLLSNLQALGTDYSQSESDSESVNSPINSPTLRRPTILNTGEKSNAKQNLAYRSSFGLHSPDGNNLGPETKDYNLKEYLLQLKKISNVDNAPGQDTNVATKKLSEMYGFEIREDTFIELDTDLIDLRAIPPPLTPDELDSLTVLNAAPKGFDDSLHKNAIMAEADKDLDRFLAKVVVAPPTQKATPVKELTPEEVMSFIIPPPPNLDEVKEELPTKPESTESFYSNAACIHKSKNMDSSNINRIEQEPAKVSHVIEYATVERKGKFSCCPKTKKEETAYGIGKGSTSTPATPSELQLPPRLNSVDKLPPIRPPKSAELMQRYSYKKLPPPVTPALERSNSTASPLQKQRPPLLPPRPTKRCDEPPVSAATVPKKPPLPAHSLSQPLALPFPNERLKPGSPNISNPVLHGPPTTIPKPTLLLHSNGHCRQPSKDSFPASPPIEKRSQLSLLRSPQMAPKFPNKSATIQFNHHADQDGKKSCHTIDGEALLGKTGVAMSGLLLKLDQIAAQCSAAQAAGGGSNIDEDKFQRARNELTEQTLVLVTASKFLVVAMSDVTLSTLPEHLTSCLTAIRRITELAQDMTRHTSSPLQTRNIVLKVHDVASSFRELVGVQIVPFNPGQLALQAECLANVLATLLRSLRVFSP